MMLSDVRDYVATLGITDADKVYMGRMDAKPDRSIGVYNSKYKHAYKVAIGGHELESYGTKYVTLLLHWNKSPRDTERVAKELFKAMEDTKEITINDEKIKFIQPIYEPQDIDTDDAGVCEWVIEMAVIYEKKGRGE